MKYTKSNLVSASHYVVIIDRCSVRFYFFRKLRLNQFLRSLSFSLFSMVLALCSLMLPFDLGFVCGFFGWNALWHVAIGLARNIVGQAFISNLYLFTSLCVAHCALPMEYILWQSIKQIHLIHVLRQFSISRTNWLLTLTDCTDPSVVSINCDECAHFFFNFALCPSYLFSLHTRSVVRWISNSVPMPLTMTQHEQHKCSGFSFTARLWWILNRESKWIACFSFVSYHFSSNLNFYWFLWIAMWWYGHPLDRFARFVH